MRLMSRRVRVLFVGLWALHPAAFARAQSVPVVLTWAEDPATSVTVFWQRAGPGRGTVRYGLTTNYTHAVSDAGGMRRHSITLRNLTPGTLYHYEASSTDGFQAGHRTFRTASGPTGSLHFAVQGDYYGGNNAFWSREVVNAIRATAPDLVIQMGDLSDEWLTPGFSTWQNFFNLTTDLLDRVVYLPAAGNHDAPWNGSAYYFQCFQLPVRPAAGSYYSYDAGGAHFTVLNSDAGVQAQTNWLMRDLQAAAYDTNTTWILPYFHRPPYSWGERPGDDFIKTNWCRLFVMYEADLVFSGHSHNYQRSVPIRGITYVISGGSGGTLYAVTNTPGSHAYATTCYHFVSMQVTGAVMRYRAIRSDGLVFEDLVWTNARRKVRVDPAFPRRGESAKILYDAAQGPLFYSSPVYIHLGLDRFTNAVVSAPMTFNPSRGLWEYDYVVSTSAQRRIAFVFRDAANTNWDNNYTYNWQALLDRVRFEPAIPTAGAPLTIHYDAAIGPLAGATQVLARIGYEDWAIPAGTWALTNHPATGWRAVTIPVPAWATRLHVLFTDGATWDNNDGCEWRVAVTAATETPPARPIPLVVAGSPVITSNPPTQNNPGDNFDLATNGTPLRVREKTGFGDFGEIYFNYDASNLYVGGISASLGGTNNVFMLFLGLDTWSDSATTLWHKSGLPQALDQLHNVKFLEPMDVAILYGSEWGDGPAYTNFMHGGYNFGQGIFYIGTNSPTFTAITNARLSQFDGTGFTPCVTGDDDGNDRVNRWEAAIPWSALNAPAGMSSLGALFVAGVVGSPSTNGNDRYLSSTYLGDRAYASRDAHGNYGFNFVVLAPTKVALEHGDEDNDGLPNGWEHGHFGSAVGTAADRDSDGDGLKDGGEYVAGTQPTNSASVFQVGLDRGSTADPIVLRWDSVSNRVYAVFQSTNLLPTSFIAVATNLPPDLPVNTYTVCVDSAQSAYHRLGVKLGPGFP